MKKRKGEGSRPLAWLREKKTQKRYYSYDSRPTRRFLEFFPSHRGIMIGKKSKRASTILTKSLEERDARRGWLPLRLGTT